MTLYSSVYCSARKSYCKKCNKKIAAPGSVCNKHGKIDDVLKLNWLLVEDRLCKKNTAKLAYKGLHDQHFPYELKLWCKIITWNSSSKEFQKNNIEFEKKYHIWRWLSESFINLPNGVCSEKLFSTFKYKSIKFF